MKKNILLLLLSFLSFYVEAGNNKEVPASHFRAPAYPLITIDPYISAWSHTDKLYEDDVRLDGNRTSFSRCFESRW